MTDGVRERVLALIHPNRAESEAQRRALERAVDCQAEWEEENGEGIAAARRGVQRVSAGNYSETYFEPRGGGFELCPDARAILFNAGLLRRELPCAKRI